MTDHRNLDSPDREQRSAHDPTAEAPSDALRGTRDDLSPEHDQPVEGGVEQAEDDSTEGRPTT